jgi:hypothetical protein
MSFNSYISDLDKLQEELYSTSVLDISKFFLPDKEILKKFIKSKNPKMSDSDIDLMTEDEETLIQEEESRLDNIQDENIKEERKKEIRERIQRRKEIYKSNIEQLKEEVKSLKNEVREAVFTLLNKSIEVTQALILAVTKTATTLPGAIVMAVAPPWNVPGAVTKILLVIKAYLDLIAIFKMIVIYLEPTRKIPLLLPNAALQGIGKTLQISVVKPMLLIFKPISVIQKIIKKIFEFIKKLFKNKNKTFKKATKRLIKLGHIRNARKDEQGTQYSYYKEDDGGQIELSDGTPITVYAYDENDIDEILGLLDQFEITNTRKWGGASHVSAFRKQTENMEKLNDDDPDFDINNMEGLIDRLESEIDNSINFPIPDDTSEFDEFIYDITLPDGTVIPNISEEGIEYFKEKFELKFDFD